MATCRKCIHWDKCSKVDGTTQFYDKGIACNNAEKLCEWFISITEVAPIADTVREMQERLKAQAINIKDHTGKMGVVVGVGNIDDVAREMLEGEK